MKIGVVLPTYKDDKGNWQELFLRFANSLTHIKQVDNLKFLVNYQNLDIGSGDEFYAEYLENVIYSTNATWELEYIYSKPYEKPISMIKIRNDCMKLDTSCDYYLFVDDDMKFNPGAGDCYNEIIDFLSKDDKIGLVMSAGFLGGYNYKNQLKFAVEKHWTVCRGLFLKNIHTSDNSPIYPESIYRIHRGGYEEMVAAMEYVAKGYKMATHFNNPTTHKVMVMDINKKDNKDRRYTDDQIHNIELSFNSISDYIKEEYHLDYQIKSAKDFQIILRILNSNN